MARTGTFTEARIWHTRPSAPPSEEAPTAAEREEWEGIAADEEAPDQLRAACAMALLYDGKKEEASLHEIAARLKWPLDRAHAAMEAVVKAGWTRRIG